MSANRKLLNIELGRVSTEEYRKLPDTGITVVLDNIRSAHNVGSVFRSSDSFKADRICLCGISPVPPSAEIHKSALGAEDSVPWERFRTTMDAVRRLKEDGYIIVSVEQTVHSVSLDSFHPDRPETFLPAISEPRRQEILSGDVPLKFAVIFGNEVAGVEQEIVDASDFSLEIPQYGTKHSLNISVTAGIVLWHFRLMRRMPK